MSVSHQTSPHEGQIVCLAPQPSAWCSTSNSKTNEHVHSHPPLLLSRPLFTLKCLYHPFHPHGSFTTPSQPPLCALPPSWSITTHYPLYHQQCHLQSHYQIQHPCPSKQHHCHSHLRNEHHGHHHPPPSLSLPAAQPAVASALPAH